MIIPIEMKKLFSLFVAASLSVCASAQDIKARQDIHNNILLSASNYTAYVDPTEADKLTPAPKGYEPFYMSHYGRHGSRWLINNGEYTEVIDVLKRARDKKKLTARGLELLEKIEHFYNITNARHRLGELSDVGEMQHHRIGKRMAEHFPEIFGAKDCQVDARSTVVIRCILSMTAECEELTRFNKNLRIHNDVSESFQYYLNGPTERRINEDRAARKKNLPFNVDQHYTHPERFWSSIINDPDYRDEKRDSRSDIMRRTFDICANMQSHTQGISLWDYFTEEECYDQWCIRNIGWYMDHSAGLGPYTQKNLLKNILETADTCVWNAKAGTAEAFDTSSAQVNKDFRGATLRFGHEVVVLPLASLLELGNAFPKVPAEGVASLDQVWRNYEIYPMACNIQLIFYRPLKGKTGDVLVKALLNEREVTLPGTPVSGPYYKWAELRDYYQKKIDQYEGVAR